MLAYTPRYSLNRMIGGPQRQYGRSRKEKNEFPLSGLETRFVQYVSWSLHRLRRLWQAPQEQYHNVYKRWPHSPEVAVRSVINIYLLPR